MKFFIFNRQKCDVFLTNFPDELSIFHMQLLISKNAVACQLLRLFAAEKDGDAILDL